ncbi:MAG: hypothetical protein ACUZ77_00740 [Candidatus Brocadiales bacterium]
MSKKCLVLTSFVAKTPTGDKRLRAGQIIRLPEKSALRLIGMGKIEELELTNRIAEPVPICASCGTSLPESFEWAGRRYCFGLDMRGRYAYDWFCLRCRPYN